MGWASSMKVSPPVSGQYGDFEVGEADLEPAGGLESEHPAPMLDGGIQIVDDDGHLAQLPGAGLVGRGLPVGAGGGPWVIGVGDLDDFEEGAVAGSGVNERRSATLMLGLAGDADAHVAQVGNEAVVLVGLEDHQVRGLAAPLQEAGAGGGFVGGSEQLHKGSVAGGQHGVVQPELGQRAGAAGFHAQDATVQVDTFGQVIDHHGDLAELGEHGGDCPLAERAAAAVATARSGCPFQPVLEDLELRFGLHAPTRLPWRSASRRWRSASWAMRAKKYAVNTITGRFATRRCAAGGGCGEGMRLPVPVGL